MATDELTLKELEIKRAMEAAQAANAQAQADAAAAATDAIGGYSPDIAPRMVTAAKDMVGQQTTEPQTTQAAEAVNGQQPATTATTPAVQPATTVTTQPATNAPATDTVTTNPPAELEQADAELKAKQEAYDLANREMLAATQAENARANKTWADYINEQYKYKKQQEQEMKQREQANMMSSMATGTTELAANIINMLSVGQLHASNQQYHSYSQDWMRKADQDMREHRHRRDNLKATIDRLKQQQEQVRTAGKIEEMKLRAAQAAEELKAAKEEAAAEAARAAAAAKNAQWMMDFNEKVRHNQAIEDIRAAGGSGRSGSGSGAGPGKRKPKGDTPGNTGSQSRQEGSRQQGGSQQSSSHKTSSTEGGERAPEGNRQQSYANAQTDPVYQNAIANGGFKDWAYRMPLEEGEWTKKREIEGWPYPKAGTPINPPKPANPTKQEEEKPKKTGTWEDEF